MMCSPHPRTPGAYKVASGDAPGHWPMLRLFFRHLQRLYDEGVCTTVRLLHQHGPHKHLRRRHRTMVSNPGSITQTHSRCYLRCIVAAILLHHWQIKTAQHLRHFHRRLPRRKAAQQPTIKGKGLVLSRWMRSGLPSTQNTHMVGQDPIQRS